ncbi:putative quinol monooxygenase [Phycicoccus flavus]|uniref:putative quinol monooxygenase n=1 Tax=Phycicoccus flavus TaxID=2502783 RepID=UPI000FEC196F|nr:antibiotic biosynthesis monooxygenase family protein [Phycicoccus flavus]NHA66615.1 antibiotic biosynthesis monooxygenase [Phycicoccus flavus]
MIIVCGHLEVDPDRRADYLERSADVVRQGRADDGCLEFSMSADLLEPGRIVVLERWRSREAVEAFRGDGPEGEQATDIRGGDVREYDVADERPLM